jgi:hypothetical protein
MRLILREVAGWLLAALGLFVLYESFAMLQQRAIIEAGSMTIIGVVVFRGGIHLLKVALAGQICTLAVERTRQDQQARTAPRPVRQAPGR